MKSKLRESVEDVAAETAGTLSKKVPAWAAGFGLLLLIGFTGVWFLRDMIIQLASNQDRIAKLEQAVEHCHQDKTRLEAEIQRLRDRVQELESRMPR